jgi:hypothetical protein
MTPEKLTNQTIELHLMDLVAVQSKNGKFGFCFTEKAGASRNESVTEFKFNTHEAAAKCAFKTIRETRKNLWAAAREEAAQGVAYRNKKKFA